MTLPVAELSDGSLVIHDVGEANRLYNRHSVGQPQTGNTLALTLVEAAWCLDANRISVRSGSEEIDLAGLLERGATEGERQEVEFLAYRDLRERGLVVRHAADGFDVWQRGEGPPKPRWFNLQVRAERDAVPVSDLAAWADDGAILAIVDEDGSVTHYQVAPEEPVGDILPANLPACTGVLLADRVLVADAVAARALAEREFIGTPVGPRLVLSFTEAAALQERGILSVSSELKGKAASQQVQFERTLAVYRDLRARGVIPKSGLKFGTHLRAYRGDPDREHAEWLIHCAKPDDRLLWSELARAVRVAHGVRKTFVVALAQTRVAYVSLSWFRP